MKADGGRFLRMSEDELWFEVADDVARKKASQGKWLKTIYAILCERLTLITILILLAAFREDKW